MQAPHELNLHCFATAFCFSLLLSLCCALCMGKRGAQSGKADLILEKHRALIRNREHSLPSKAFLMPRTGLVLSGSHHLTWQPPWDKSRMSRFHLTAQGCMDMALVIITFMSFDSVFSTFDSKTSLSYLHCTDLFSP